MLVAHNPYQRKVIINADASQAEARVVARMCTALSGMKCNMDKIFEEGRKIHVVFASRISGKPEVSIPKDNNPGSLYYTAKRVVHASDYDMGIIKMAIIIKKSVAETTRLSKEFHILLPEIRSVFHAYTQQLFKASRTMVNAYGRPHTFLGRVDNDLFRRGYAYYPQSTVADLITLAYSDFFYAKKPAWECDLLLTTHDSITFQMLPDVEMITEACTMLRAFMEAPMQIFGHSLTIPAEFTLGRNYRDQHKFSSPDSIAKLLHKLGYIYEETPGLYPSVHETHSGSRIPRGLSLLDGSGDNGSSDPYEHLFR